MLNLNCRSLRIGRDQMRETKVLPSRKLDPACCVRFVRWVTATGTPRIQRTRTPATLGACLSANELEALFLHAWWFLNARQILFSGACSRTTKCTRNLFLNNRIGHEYPPFEASLDGNAISTAFKTWMLWTSSTVQEPLHHPAISQPSDSAPRQQSSAKTARELRKPRTTLSLDPLTIPALDFISVSASAKQFHQ